MKVKSTFLYLAFISIALLLLNNASGPAAVQGVDRTGSPLSPGSCNTAGCHDSGAFDPTVSIEILSNNMAISGYEPGASYQVRITIDAATGTPSTYGFQTVALNSNDDNAGTWNFPNGGQQLVGFATGVEYMEHSTPSASNVITTATWEAPAIGGGDVIFYVGALASNNSGNPAGDGGAVNSITLTEGFMVNSNEIEQPIGFSLFPNPALDFLNVNITSNDAGLAQLRILDMTGKMVHTEEFGIHQGENLQHVDIENLNSGLYLFNLIHGDQVVSEKFLKM